MSQSKPSPSKSALAMAYSAKRRGKSPQSSCDDCMTVGGKCMAHGGEVGNEDLHQAHAEASMAPHEMVDQDMSSQEESSMDEEDRPHVSESMSLADAIMKDRRRMKMARGGMVHDEDEMDAPMEDGRESRGLNAEPAHVMEDSEHEQSDASLVSQILMDRKRRRGGM